MSREAALAVAPQAASPGSAPPRPDPRPEIAPQYRFSWRALPRDIKLLAIGLIVVLLGGVAWLFVPYRPDPIVPLLGWSEPTSGKKPQPKASPRPRRGAPAPSPAPRKGWLPW